MSTSETPEASRVVRQAVNVIFGLVVVCALLIASVMVIGQAWLGVLLGAAELAVASKVTPPAGARSLRWVTGMFGAFTLAFSVLWLVLS